MAEPKFLTKIKERWGITSNWDFLIICIVFGLTGTTVVELKKWVIYPFLNINSNTPIYTYILLWLFVFLPIYYFFLLLYGTIFRKQQFFLGMVKKSIGRFGKPFKRKTQKN